MTSRRLLGSSKLFFAGFSLATFCHLFFDFNAFRALSSTTTPNTKTQEQLLLIAKTSHVQLVLYVGLEGTGHHLLGQIAKGSPMFQQLKDSRIFPVSVQDLHYVLFNDQNKKGLWNAHCYDDVEKNSNFNSTDVQSNVVRILKKMERKASEALFVTTTNNNYHQESSKKKKITVPVNTMNGRFGVAFGEVSYPNFLGPCRSLNYPSLGIWYDACDKAKVDCRHVYLHRDPYQVIESTTRKRLFNTDVLKAIHMYTSLLKIIASELTTFASRTIGCFGFFENDSSHWMEPVRKMYGWGDDNKTVFEEFMKQTYRKPQQTIMTEEERNEIVSPTLDVYMKAFLEAHDRVIEICRENLRQFSPKIDASLALGL
jgi:hypothetical protein